MIKQSIQEWLDSDRLWIDVAAIAVLLLLHPVVYRLDAARGIFSPDATAYIEFAEYYLSAGLFYMERGLAGTGDILPPIYPFLILAVNTVVDDFLVSSIVVSNITTIFSSVIFYLLIRKFGNPFFAFSGTLLIQLNYTLNAWALTPLTEASFIAVMACSLLLLLRVLGNGRMADFVLLGLLMGIGFLTRQVAILLFPFFFLVIALARPRNLVVRCLSVALGIILLLAPYVIVVQEQGRQLDASLSAFEPKWSKRDIILIDDVDQQVQDYLHRVHGSATDDYRYLYVKRRTLMQLLPDGSAMLSEVAMTVPERGNGAILNRLVRIWSSMDGYTDNLIKNIQHIVSALGPMLCGVFVIFLVTPLLVRTKQNSLLARYVIGGFVLYYLAAISLLTGLVGRYVGVLGPFILLHIAIEAAIILSVMQRKTRRVLVVSMMYPIVAASLAFAQPMNFSDVEYSPKRSVDEFPISNLRQFVKARDPILSLRPFHSYVAGGSWRTLPNDSLEKIVKYARSEKIPWLLVVDEPSVPVTALKLTQQWYLDPHLSSKHKDLIQLRAMSSDGKSQLYQIKGVE